MTKKKINESKLEVEPLSTCFIHPTDGWGWARKPRKTRVVKVMPM